MISEARVNELKSEMGEDDFEEIGALFIAESDRIVGKLRSVREPADAEALLHALKGSALNLGFDTLAGLCREGEGAHAGSPVWSAKFDRLDEIYRQSKSRLTTIV